MSFWAPHNPDDTNGSILAGAIVVIALVVGTVVAVATDDSPLGGFVIAFLIALLCPLTWLLGWGVERVATGGKRHDARKRMQGLR